jgi:hypothetical protein
MQAALPLYLRLLKGGVNPVDADPFVVQHKKKWAGGIEEPTSGEVNGRVSV